jgi:hypothetical protein
LDARTWQMTDAQNKAFEMCHNMAQTIMTANDNTLADWQKVIKYSARDFFLNAVVRNASQ